MADERISWYSQTAKSTANKTDKVMIYDGSKTYIVPISAILALVDTTSGSGSSSSESSNISLPLDITDGTKVSFSELSGILSTNDTDTVLVIREDGSIKKVNVNDLKGEGTLTENYMTLTEEIGTSYRITVGNDGNLKVVKDSAYTATPPAAGQNTNFHGLLINSMYGAGTAVTGMPVSHNFIELYNNTATEKSLEGLYIWYKDTTNYTSWEGLALHGSIAPYSSFLIVGGQCANRWDTDCRHYIENYDQRWMAGETGLGMKFSDNGFSVYLSATGDTPPDTPDAFTKDASGAYTTNTTDNYIDLMGGGGLTAAPPCANLYYRSGMTNKIGLKKVDFYNRFKLKDFSNYITNEWCANDWRMTELVNYTNCPEGKFPKSSADGHWNMFDNYMDMFNQNGVNYVNIAVGEDAQTRCFCFQMKASRDDAFVWYRKKGTSSWTAFKCTITKWRHPNMDVNICKAIIKNLELGATYEYRLGTEGIQSGVHEFKIFNKDLSAGDTLRILWTSDPQGWNETEMKAYRNVCSKIMEWESNEDGSLNFDMWHSTGDETQNGIRVNPEMYWSNYARGEARWSVPFASNIGNNDLYKKNYGNGFQVNYCNEQSNQNFAWNGFFFQRIDDVLIVNYSSNEDLDYVTGKGGAYSEDETLGGCATWDEFLQREAAALESLLNPIMKGENPPQWVIMATHQMPVTCTRQAKMQKFIPVIEKYCDLHIGGHQHCFTASKPLRTGYDGTSPYNFYFDANQSPQLQNPVVDESGINKYGDKAKGVRYISLNASGYKCSGKQSVLNNVKKHYAESAVSGSESGSGNFDYYSDSFLPWWHDNGEYSTGGQKGANVVKNPNYAIIEASSKKLHVIVYQVTGNMSSEDVNGVKMPVAPDFESVKNSMNRTVIYECEILASDRDRTGRV